MSRRRRFTVMLATISCSFPVGIALAPGTTTGSGDTALTVVVDDRSTIRPINPLIMGMSGDVDAAYIRDVGVTLNSWGGNPSTRYNYRIGHAWNNGSDWEYLTPTTARVVTSAPSSSRIRWRAVLRYEWQCPRWGGSPKTTATTVARFPRRAEAAADRRIPRARSQVLLLIPLRPTYPARWKLCVTGWVRW